MPLLFLNRSAVESFCKLEASAAEIARELALLHIRSLLILMSALVHPVVFQSDASFRCDEY